MIKASPRTQMRQGYPGVLRVPDDRWQRAECEGSQEKIKAGSLEFPAQARDERKHEHNRDELKGVRVLAKKSEPGEQTSHRPVPGRIRTPFEDQPKCGHGRHPKENRERIDCHDEIADVEKRNRVQGEHGPEPRGRVVKTTRKIV